MNVDKLLEMLGITNPEPLIERFAGSKELIARFMQKFPDEGTYEQIVAARKSGDIRAAADAVHTLKGVSLNLGLDKLGKLCSDMMTELRAGKTSISDEEFAPIKAEYERVSACIREFFA